MNTIFLLNYIIFFLKNIEIEKKLKFSKKNFKKYFLKGNKKFSKKFIYKFSLSKITTHQ